MKRLRWYDYITYNIYWLGLNVGSGSLTPIILPALVVRFVDPSMKNSWFGALRAAGLVVAILVQPAAGLLSDRCTSRWGRRRPFIAVGALLTAFTLLGVGLAGSYWMLFAVSLLMQFASNIAHGALQGIIPDLVPEDQRGRASAVKALMELAPMVLLAATIGRFVDSGQLWAAIATIFAMYIVTMLITVAAVHETPIQEKPAGSLREPLLRVLGLLLGVAVGGLLGVAAGGVGGGLVGLAAWPFAGQARAWLVGASVAGLIAIVVSIVAGVWAAVQISADARRYPSFTWWVVNRLLFLTAVGSLQGYAQYFLADVLHLPNPAEATGLLTRSVGIFTLVAALSSGFLAERMDRRMLVTGSGLLAALGTCLLLLAGNVTVVLIAGCLIGMAAGVFLTTNWALGTDLVPPEEAGRFLGISNLAGAGAGIVGAGLGGPLVDYLNKLSAGSGYLVIFGIFAVCFALSVVALRQVRQPAQRAAAQG